MSDDERAVLVRIRGRVQGVSFRAFAQEEAQQRGIRGWVVNLPDGSVEAALHGPGAALGELVGRLRQGPPAAAVDGLDVQSADRSRIADVPPEGVTF